MLRIFHVADQHFEQERLDACTASGDFVLGCAVTSQPQLILSAGDIFNRAQTLNDRSAIAAARKYIIGLAEVAPVVMVKGNEAHDNAGCLEVFRDLNTKHPVLVTERCETWGLTHTGKFLSVVDNPEVGFKAVVHMMSYPEKGWFLRDKGNLSIDESNLLIREALRSIFIGMGAMSADANCPVLFVGHGNMEGSILSSGQTLLGQDILISKHDLALVGADYYALGHIHDAQEIAPNMWYAGSGYHCNWGETKKKQFNVVEIDETLASIAGVQTRVSGIEHIIIPSTPMSLHEAEWDPQSGWCDEHPENDWTDAKLRIRVHLTKETSDLITDEQIKSNYPGAFSYKIDRTIIPTERIRSSEITRAATLREKVSEWGKSVGRELHPTVLQYADEIEGVTAE